MPLDVLLVDDRPANLQALAAVLEGPDVQLHTAGGGAEALRAMRTHDFAVVLLDVQMPDLDGFEVARLMRARRRTRSTPIIFVTGIEQPPDSVFAGYEAGAVDFLVKPLDPVIVRSKVQVFLELHRQRLLVVQQAGELAERVRQVEEAHRALGEKTRALEASEAAVRTLNAELEERVATRTRELARANEQLEAFVFSASHNLRSPLRTIEGFVSLLLDTCGEQLVPDDRDLLERVAASAAHMAELLSALLRLARLHHAEPSREAVDVAGVARRVVAGLRALAPDRAVRVDLPDRAVVQADPALVLVLLEVLLDNAWKYTGQTPGARIALTVEETTPARFTLTDNGVGFDPTLTADVFRPFTRLHSPRDFDGVGLGLATARQAVRAHGGRIEADSEPERGARFRFTLGPETAEESP
ncbi:MAG: response regulator [Myxococcales bacterium]|nr:response regulator [Myxococcales bacterium]